MNFTDVVTNVVEMTKRPEKVVAIRREVNSAITFFCLDNDFPRDYTEQKIILDPLEYTQSFSIADLTRFRKFKYLRRGPKAYLTVLTDNEIFNRDIEQGTLFRDRYYLAGDVINISLMAQVPTIDVGYYMYPPLLTGGGGANNFWMLDVAPYMVIDRAAAALFRTIGDEKSMQTCMVSATENYRAFMKDQRSVL